MISEDNWETMDKIIRAKYKGVGFFNVWMKENYNAIEIPEKDVRIAAGNYRVYEFDSSEKYTEFCLQWL